ncbi:type II toxin-antitoxin system prevent-host-death family antitoxin [Jiella sonneratiae]|uniref:Antitoxin n=1 Tax=Jiella sonneratiae TaxID=2816856 RepID=A0ABS3J495_9HYPH|nr:type II toxin-antitoxin system prevent-host-death family antitoxin [Jiella sonneratiae]MBO0904506.1 type II toxin-antitoxin system prevent-host-death family antitoxin [Jiella sonneratiae]
MATISSRELNQDIGAAKRAAAVAPVVVTDRGKPAFVLMTYEEYRRMSGDKAGPTMLDLLASEDAARIDIDFERPAQSGRDVTF